jgi:pimeloyl-ACP methyl ester carboxylesterase
VLLHGFPDSAQLWRNQVPPLVEAGFRVITPDLRGYGRSDHPLDVGSYSLVHPAGDVIAILDELEIPKAHVVGHDFGAALSWVTATFFPDRVDHLVAMSVGHPSAFDLTSLVQGRLSWYILLFQHEGVAEQWLSVDAWANLREWSGHPDADGVIEQMEATGALTQALNWYRANITPQAWIAPAIELPQVQAPTMGVWSSDDFALTEAQMVDSAAHVAGPWRYERVDGAGHWLQLDAPDEVSRLLVDFLPR